MIIDECLLVLIHSQEDPPPPRPTARKKPSSTIGGVNRATAAALEEEHAIAPKNAMHSIDELAIIGCVDSMPVMKSTRRIRAPASMAARPRIGKRFSTAPARSEPPLPPPPPSRRVTTKTQRRKPLALVSPPRGSAASTRRTSAPIQQQRSRTIVTPQSLIANLDTPDIKVKTRAMELVSQDIKSEPTSPIHTAIRVILQAALELGRPYDTNMLAATFGVTRSLVMQALRKYYEGYAEQSTFTEAHFVPTYLWLYGLEGDEDAVRVVVKAIGISGAAEPGSRSVFAIARDFVILYLSEVVYGAESKGELAGLSSVAAVMHGIKIPEEVPPCFVEMTNSFLYRARMTGRAVMRARPQVVQECGGTIAGIFSD